MDFPFCWETQQQMLHQLTEETWNALLVPLWSISWQRQETKRANTSLGVRIESWSQLRYSA